MIDDELLWKIVKIIVFAVVGAFALRKIIAGLRVLYADRKNRIPGIRFMASIAVGFVAAIVVAVYRQFKVTPFSDFFSACERAFVWWIMISCVLYVTFCIKDIVLFLIRIPVWRTVLAVALFPIAFVITEHVFECAGFPLFKALMNAWDDWMGIQGNPGQLMYFDSCQGAVKGVTLIIWGATAKYAIFPKNWLVLIPLFALGAIVGTFIPLGLVMLVLICLLVYVLGPYIDNYIGRWFNANQFLDTYYYGKFDGRVRDELVKEIMWHDRFKPKNRG